ncbi:MAG: LexA family transcriptional regulator [Clostridia bacterium]|nr:LexA family transcriptional regulator [Clostridia bacterium]
MNPDFSSLTSKQKKIYYAIEAFIKSKKIPPTVREIGEMVGEKTPGAVQGILNRLEQKGVIKREIGMARSIQLVSNHSHYVDPLYIPEVKKVNKRNVSDLLNIYNINKYQPVAPDIVESEKDCFMIKCPDNSLLESGIKYEDMLIISRECDIKDGDTVLVVYENHSLLRRYFADKQENFIKLEADVNLINKDTFEKDEVVIVGKLVGKYTKY